MEKLNRSFVKKFNAVLVALLGFLGFSGCDIIGKVEYGSPHANYQIKGQVVDKATGEAIKGIKVQILNHSEAIPDDVEIPHFLQFIDTTDVNGNFAILHQGFPRNRDMPLFAHVTDIDSIENGWFYDKVIELEMRNFEQTKPASGNWFSGEFTKTINVKLTERDTE